MRLHQVAMQAPSFDPCVNDENIKSTKHHFVQTLIATRSIIAWQSHSAAPACREQHGLSLITSLEIHQRVLPKVCDLQFGFCWRACFLCCPRQGGQPRREGAECRKKVHCRVASRVSCCLCSGCRLLALRAQGIGKASRQQQMRMC